MWEEISNANKAIQATNIKGKMYVEVNQRIKAFRMVFPGGFIITDIISNVDGVVIMKAIVGSYDAEGNKKVLGHGTAYEKEGSTFINKTSYIENCETSAVGRALGMAGFGIDTSVASAEEVQNAILNQAAADKITDVQIKALRSRCNSDKVDVKKICDMYKVGNLADLTVKQYSHINLNWDKIR